MGQIPMPSITLTICSGKLLEGAILLYSYCCIITNRKWLQDNKKG